MPEPCSLSVALLPRRMAIKLLEIVHQAGATPLRLLVTCGINAKEPDGIEMLEPDTTWEGAIARLPRQNRMLWATFQHVPIALASPSADEVVAGLYLAASLDVPGVLQIHAWRRAGGEVIEVPLKVTS